MKLSIGKIPYLNSVLFYHEMESGNASRLVSAGDYEFELLPLVPRQLSGAAVESVVDAGPVPLVTYWDIEDRYEPLDFCIATPVKAYSILLFSRKPFDALGGASVGVTKETSTSVRLMSVLLENVYKARPSQLVPVDRSRNDAFLLIGDEALRNRRGVDGFPHIADLGQVWNDWTDLPFVFARWVVRRGLDQSARNALIEVLEGSLESGVERMDTIVAPHAAVVNMSVSEMRGYLEEFHFRMAEAEHEAVATFRRLDADIRRAGAATTPG